MARKRKAGELSEAQALRLRNRLHQDWLRFYHVPVLESVIDLARHLADEHSLRGADAIHLASAVLLREYLKSRIDEVMWVCSDRELNFAAERRGFSTVDPVDNG